MSGLAFLAEVNEFVTKFMNKRIEFEKEKKSLHYLDVCHIHFYFRIHVHYFDLLESNSHKFVIICYMKILLRAFNIDIQDIENTLPT